MKTKILLFIIFIIAGLQTTIAQNDRANRREQIRAQKVAFITSELQLTVDEAQKFWPVYNEFDAKREKILENRRDYLQKYIKNPDNLSDKEYEKLSDDVVKTQLDEAKLVEEYHVKFKLVLPAKKVVSLYKAEFQFKNKLLKQIRDKARENKDNVRPDDNK